MAQNQRRMVYSKIWSSTQFASLTDRAKILFVGMITLADDDGRIIANASYLRGQIFSFDEEMEISDIKEARLEIENKNLIEVYEVDGVDYIQHPNWKKYQVIRADLYTPSTLPDRNGSVTKPLRVRNEAVTKKTPKLSKDKLSKDKNKSEVEKSNIIGFTPRDMEMVDLLISLIQTNSPEWQMKGNKDTWAEHINKLHRLDGRTYEQIEYMIRWVQKSDFWWKNILSTSKLREKFNGLIPKVQAKTNNDPLSKIVW